MNKTYPDLEESLKELNLSVLINSFNFLFLVDFIFTRKIEKFGLETKKNYEKAQLRIKKALDFYEKIDFFLIFFSTESFFDLPNFRGNKP